MPIGQCNNHNNIVIFTGMIIGFSEIMNTAIEADGYVEVCVEVQKPERVLRPFKTVLLPEEGL